MARMASGRVPRVRTEGVGGHRRARRRIRAGVGGTQRRREVPRVERIILLVNRVEWRSKPQKTEQQWITNDIAYEPRSTDFARIRL